MLRNEGIKYSLPKSIHSHRKYSGYNCHVLKLLHVGNRSLYNMNILFEMLSNHRTICSNLSKLKKMKKLKFEDYPQSLQRIFVLKG